MYTYIMCAYCCWTFEFCFRFKGGEKKLNEKKYSNTVYRERGACTGPSRGLIAGHYRYTNVIQLRSWYFQRPKGWQKNKIIIIKQPRVRKTQARVSAHNRFLARARTMRILIGKKYNYTIYKLPFFFINLPLIQYFCIVVYNITFMYCIMMNIVRGDVFKNYIRPYYIDFRKMYNHNWNIFTCIAQE